MSRLRVLAAASALVVTLAASGCGGDGGEGEAGAGPDMTTGLPASAPAPSTTTTAAPAETTTTTPAPTTTAPEPEVVEVVMGPSKVTFTYPAGLSPDLRPAFDQYLAFLTAGIANGLNPNPLDPAIDATSTGDVNRSWRSRVQNAQLVGTRFSGPLVANPVVSESTDSHVRLLDCGWDQATTVSATGTIVSPPRPDYEVVHVVLEHDSIDWRISVFQPSGAPCRP